MHSKLNLLCKTEENRKSKKILWKKTISCKITMVRNQKTVLMFEDVYTRPDKGLNPMDHSNQRKKKNLFYLLLMMLVYSCSKEIKTMPERKKRKETFAEHTLNRCCAWTGQVFQANPPLQTMYVGHSWFQQYTTRYGSPDFTDIDSTAFDSITFATVVQL